MKRKTKSKTKIHFLENKRVYLPKGVSTETWPSGEQRFVVTWQEHGKKKKKSFPWTQGGLDEAKALNETLKKEVKKYGAEFGNITTDEKVALDYIRQYIKEAQSNGFIYSQASEIVKEGLEKRRTTSPDFNTLARYYFDKEVMRKTDGELTEHAETVSNRLFNHICPVFGDKPAHTILEEEIETFIDTLKGKKEEKASLRTRNQYLSLIKTVFKFSIKKKMIPFQYNPAADIPLLSTTRKEPAILTVEEVKRIFTFVKNNPKYHHFIPVLAVGFFCGARVAERAKMTYNDIFVGGRDEIYIPATHAKNTKARFVNSTDNFKMWMKFAKSKGVSMNVWEYLLEGETAKQRREKHNKFLEQLSAKTGVLLPKNCIRHTAASFMSVILGKKKTAEQMGHDINMLDEHYRCPITETQAKEYLNITPDSV